MSILLRRTAALCALLALALCLPQGSLLLCVGEAGHFALEAVCDPGNAVVHADDHGGGHAAEAEGHCECAGECGPCQDAQVGTELSPGRTRDDSAPASELLPAPSPFAATLAALAAPPAPLRQASRLASGPPPPPFARVQAGVSLRI